jgi:ribose/xylose/arabinose/galactoside ABC-type transport system permease subunit
VASALGLRAGVPNLAVGALAFFGATWLVQHAGGGWAGTAAQIAAWCALLGLVQGLLVVTLHVPSWAVSLAVAVGLAGWAGSQDLPSFARLGYDPVPDAYVWFAGVAAFSVLASVLGLHPGLRRGFGRFRPVTDPARRRGWTAAVIAVTVTVVSSALAGFAGAFAQLAGQAVGGFTTSSAGPLGFALVYTALGVGVALVGGTSVFGRRGGILGTVLAAALVTVTVSWLGGSNPQRAVSYVLAAAIVLGLAATRLVERFGRPVLRPSTEEDRPWARTPVPPGAQWGPGPTPAGGLWSSDEVWGTPGR